MITWDNLNTACSKSYSNNFIREEHWKIHKFSKLAVNVLKIYHRSIVLMCILTLKNKLNYQHIKYIDTAACDRTKWPGLGTSCQLREPMSPTGKQRSPYRDGPEGLTGLKDSQMGHIMLRFVINNWRFLVSRE